MSCVVTHEGPVASIRIQGRFTFDSHQPFREAYLPLVDRRDTKIIRLDLAETSFIDSSSLGMLLLMRERMLPVGKAIEISGANELVMKLLKIANFHKMFAVQGA
ncbi:MAG: STAS domain-containing protein [Pseudomonadota bacterium]|nr:STAS domain-containing protein [Pseudomonadota bacterium]